METQLPKDKLQRMCILVRDWLTKKKATKREILSLVGLLQHATKVARCGRPFLSRMYVCHSSQTQRTTLLHMSEKRFLLRFALVEHLPSRMEWP